MTIHIGIETLSALLDDELSVEDAALAANHLRDCLQCQRTMRELEAMRTAVRALPASQRPAGDVWSKIVSARRRRQRRDSVRRTILRAAGIAAVAVAGALSARWWYAVPEPPDVVATTPARPPGTATPEASDVVALQDAAAEFVRRLEAMQQGASLSDAERAAAREVALAALVSASAALEDSSSLGVALSPIVGELARMRVAGATPGRINRVMF